MLGLKLNNVSNCLVYVNSIDLQDTWQEMPILSSFMAPVAFYKTRIVRILFSCMFPQTDNCCPTIVYRHLQRMSLLIDVSGVLRGQLYDWIILRLKIVVFTVVFVIVFTVKLMLFLLCILDHILECDILWMYLFLPYCVRKWHNKTVQSYMATFKRDRTLYQYKCHPHQWWSCLLGCYLFVVFLYCCLLFDVCIRKNQHIHICLTINVNGKLLFLWLYIMPLRQT